MKRTRDQNGNIVTKSVRKEEKGWGANVWFGGAPGCGCATNLTRYFYDTKSAAMEGDISNDIGACGRVA